MQDFKTVKKIYQTVSKCHKKFALLHCVSSYPTPTKQINLKVLELYKREFPNIPIGYSGHETDSIITVGAVALGATIIERHITLNKNLKGSDHRCSLEPFEFKQLVDNINLLIQGLGRPVKMIQDCEKDCYRKLRKTITASTKLTVGTVLNKNDIKIKVAEPFGLDGSISDWVIGKEIVKDLDEDEPITENCLKFN